MIIIGHQGAKGYYRGNTLRSIKLAKNLNAQIIELDVRLLDNEKLFVLHHDEEIKVFNLDEGFKEKKVEECLWNELKGLGICTLNNALGEFESDPEFIMYLDIKIDKEKDNEYLRDFGERLIEVFKELNLLVLVCSFNKNFIKEFSKLEGSVNFNLGFIFEKDEEFQNHESVDIMVFHHETNYNKKLMTDLKNQDKVCFVYTVNTDEEKNKIIKEKLYDGYVTDFP